MHQESTDVLIVGAGLAGAATAYHLARLGGRELLLVEKESTPGVHSSGRNASVIRERTPEKALQPLNTEGAEFLRTGKLAEYSARGAMIVGWGDEDAGLHCPVARGRGLWCPRDGTADVAGLLQSYLAGRRILFDTEVLDWKQAGNGLRVHTNRGEIACKLLVNAAGPWAGQLGKLPLTPTKRHIFVTPPLKWVDASWPFVWNAQEGLYFRPESGGLLLSPCDESPAEPGDYAEDPAMVERLAVKIATLQPALKDVSIMRSWVGHRTFAPDHAFVIGFDPRDAALFHVAALGGHGVTSSYAVGRLAAELILGRADAKRTVPFTPSRLFAGR